MNQYNLSELLQKCQTYASAQSSFKPVFPELTQRNDGFYVLRLFFKSSSNPPKTA